MQNNNVIDLYSVGHEEVTRDICNIGTEVPFQSTLHLLAPQGEIVRVVALFDGCAMVSAMCVTVFEKVKHRLGKWGQSVKQLIMGNGTMVPSLATWKGKMRLGEVAEWKGNSRSSIAGAAGPSSSGSRSYGPLEQRKHTKQIQSVFATSTEKKQNYATKSKYLEQGVTNQG